MHLLNNEQSTCSLISTICVKEIDMGV